MVVQHRVEAAQADVCKLEGSMPQDIDKQFVDVHVTGQKDNTEPENHSICTVLDHFGRKELRVVVDSGCATIVVTRQFCEQNTIPINASGARTLRTADSNSLSNKSGPQVQVPDLEIRLGTITLRKKFYAYHGPPRRTPVLMVSRNGIRRTLGQATHVECVFPVLVRPTGDDVPEGINIPTDLPWDDRESLRRLLSQFSAVFAKSVPVPEVLALAVAHAIPLVPGAAKNPPFSPPTEYAPKTDSSNRRFIANYAHITAHLAGATADSELKPLAWTEVMQREFEQGPSCPKMIILSPTSLRNYTNTSDSTRSMIVNFGQLFTASPGGDHFFGVRSLIVTLTTVEGTGLERPMIDTG
ncbi:hypothetical protein V1504DRAFT_434963 [Lipomyces starkeyi]